VETGRRGLERRVRLEVVCRHSQDSR